MVKRVRGVAYSCRMPPQTSNRLVDGVRGMLNDLLADVYVFTDHMSGAAAGASPGYGVTLVAETTSGRLLAAQASSEGAQVCNISEYTLSVHIKKTIASTGANYLPSLLCDMQLMCPAEQAHGYQPLAPMCCGVKSQSRHTLRRQRAWCQKRWGSWRRRDFWRRWGAGAWWTPRTSRWCCCCARWVRTSSTKFGVGRFLRRRCVRCDCCVISWG